MRQPLVLSALVLSALVSFAGPAAADPPAASYRESRVEGGSVVAFEIDGLQGGAPMFAGDTIRRPPGAVRVGLVRPRFNFVPELLKSVENL